MSALNQPRLEAYIGASGSGKGVSIARRLQELQPNRLLIWDPRDEYRQHGRQVRQPSALIAEIRAQQAKGGRLQVRMVPEVPPSMDHKRARTYLAEAFAIFCGAAFALGDLVMVVEELSDVTQPSHAPPAWRQCVTQGRHRALHIIAATQRPALIDKTMLGNATRIRCFTLRYANDRRVMAEALDVDQSAVNELQTVEETKGGRVHVSITYLERDFRARTIETQTMRLSRKATSHA